LIDSEVVPQGEEEKDEQKEGVINSEGDDARPLQAVPVEESEENSNGFLESEEVPSRAVPVEEE